MPPGIQLQTCSSDTPLVVRHAIIVGYGHGSTARNHRRIRAPHTRTFNHGAALALAVGGLVISRRLTLAGSLLGQRPSLCRDCRRAQRLQLPLQAPKLDSRGRHQLMSSVLSCFAVVGACDTAARAPLTCQYEPIRHAITPGLLRTDLRFGTHPPPLRHTPTASGGAPRSAPAPDAPPSPVGTPPVVRPAPAGG